MKNFKKIATLLAVLLVAMSLLLVMASCGGDETDASSEQSSTVDSEGGTVDSTEDSSSNSSSTGDSSSTDSGSTDNSGTTDNSSANSSTQDSNTGSDNSSSNDGSSSNNGDDKPDVPPVENPNLVKVTVLNQLGNPIKDAVVQICQGETCFAKPIITGKDGVGTREYSSMGKEALKAKIISIDGIDDFVSSANYVYFEEGSRELTIYVQRVSVNVFDDSEQAIEGAVVQLYQGETPLDNTVITDAEGTAFAFVALNGENFSAKVTEILFGSGYDIPKNITELGEGEYEGSIVVRKNASYSVRVMNMFGDPLAGAKIKLYAGNVFEDVATTNENGIAIFENLKEGEYSVEVSFVSPAYKVIGANEEDGRFHFPKDSTSIEVMVVDSDVTYTISVLNGTAGSVIDVLNLDNQIIETIETDENGKAYFIAPNGYYTAVLRTEGEYAEPAIFVKDDDAVGEIKVTNKTAGTSKDAPIVLTGEFNMSLEAGQTVWFAVPNANKKTVTIISANGIGFKMGEGTDFLDDGDTEFVPGIFTANKGEMMLFAIQTKEAQGVTVKPSAPGTQSDPIDLSGTLSDTETTVKIPFEIDTNVYYSYTAEKDGVILVNPDFATVYFNEYEMGIDVGGKYAFPVKAGETVVIFFNYYEEADVEITFAFGEIKTDYTVSVNNDSWEAVEGVVVVFYVKNGDELVEIARKTTDADGICIFESMDISGNYIIKVENCPEGYEALYEEVEVGMSNYASYALSLIKTGEPEAPFEFDTYDELKETASVKENGTVWYTLYVRPSMESKFYILAKSANAVIKIYNEDTNNDGIINGEDTPIGASAVVGNESTYVFEANNTVYTIAVSTADGSAEDIEIVYASQNLPEGSNVETAVEITEAGTYTAEVDDMVYYVFLNDESCKLTVTLTGEATLKIVHRSMDETTLEDAENNTYTIDTEGLWIYFVIAAENAGSYEFTVTVE